MIKTPYFLNCSVSSEDTESFELCPVYMKLTHTDQNRMKDSCVAFSIRSKPLALVFYTY